MVIVSFITFSLVQFAPGDPVRIRLGQHSSPEAFERIREELGLNDSLVVQYARYMGGVFKLDFGDSLSLEGRTVRELLGKRVPISAQLGLAALIISVGLGIPAGLYAALRQGTVWDSLTVMATLVGQSLPVFLTVPVLLWLFALKLDILPTHGLGRVFR